MVNQQWKRKKMKFLMNKAKMDKLRAIFGSLQLKEPTQKAMEKIDEGYD